MNSLRRVSIVLIWVAALMLVIGAAAFYLFQGPALLHVFTGGSARLMCSGVFAASRDEAFVREQEFGRTTSPGKFLGMVDVELDRKTKTVTAALYGLGRRQAVFRDGIGCTSTDGTTVAELRAQGSGGSTALAPTDPQQLWPEGSATLIGQLPPNIDAGKLDAVLDAAFSEPDPQRPRNTRAMVVVHRGRIIAEQYGDGFDQNTGHLSNSMAKTFTGALIGILVRQGALHVDARAPIEEWSDPQDPRYAITLGHLLRMQSGLVFEETYTRVKSDITMMYAGGDLAGFAAAKPLETAPGENWKYSTGTANILGRIVSENAGNEFAERLSFPRRALFDPLGMRHTVMEADRKGNFVGGSSVYATARDYARFGLLYLRDGVWNGDRILPEGWVEYTLTPTPNAPPDRAYGVQVWLNSGGDASIRRWQELPPDAFVMAGHQGQYVAVIPSRDLIVVRLGLTEFHNWNIGTVAGQVMAAIAPQSGMPAAHDDDEVEKDAGILKDVDKLQRSFAQSGFEVPADRLTVNPAANADRNAYFGDLHVHTTYSLDAFVYGTLATPHDAYRYARGEPIKHPGGFSVQLRRPLDFYAVTDHAEFLGFFRAAADTSSELAKYDLTIPYHNFNAPENLTLESVPLRSKAFRTFLPQSLLAIASGEVDIGTVDGITRSAWADVIKAAEQFNQPGTFTTFVGFEYTSSSDDLGNLHRNVIFRGADKLPAIPFSRFHQQNPEKLWAWMDDLREEGIDSLAIPHNSNGSNGQMFTLVDWAGNPIDDSYARQRMRNEPLVEVTQVKGTSETHPDLSQTDEWAGFEIMPYRVATDLPSEPNGSYVRQAYLRGLALEATGAGNPYKFGLIGSSDTHNAATSVEESDFFSKIGLQDSNGVHRGAVPIPKETVAVLRQSGTAKLRDVDGRTYRSGAYETWGASGLAAVWAEANTREAIYDAFRRRETFATSGPRIRLRFFGGYGFDEALLGSPDMVARAYALGVTMGSNLQASEDESPSFIVWAVGDADSARLQRLQIVKGWTVEGVHHELVYDAACSDGLEVDPANNRCPDNGARVDLSDCSVTAGVGATELKTVWKDPDFDPDIPAFYYVRVLENPTCRWSTWDALRAGVAPRSDLAATIQERAWSSPIWLLTKRQTGKIRTSAIK